jgi:hypothetical protein
LTALTRRDFYNLEQTADASPNHPETGCRNEELTMMQASRTMRFTSTAAILAMFLGLAAVAGAQSENKERKENTSKPAAGNRSEHGGNNGHENGGNAGHENDAGRESTTRTSTTTRSVTTVRDVHTTSGANVHTGFNGNRTVTAYRPGNTRIVAVRGRAGFVEHPFTFRGATFTRRTYVFNGRVYGGFYRGFGFRGVMLNVYAPGFFFRPAFYGWAYNPWPRPIVFAWGWGPSPWYGYYGYYFQPYPSYPSAAFWLTDYMISSDLQASYAAQQDNGGYGPPPQDGQAALTPDVKQAIADEVRNQLALENQEAQQSAQQQNIDPGSSGIARMLSDGQPHAFLVGGPLDVTDLSGAACGLSEGDVLELRTDPPPNAPQVALIVAATKGGNECQRGNTVWVGYDALQEMQNQMRAGIDQGLQTLQSQQGSGGLPTAPPAAQGQATPAPYAAIAPPPDPNAATEIQQEQQQADQANTQEQAAPPAQP